MWADTLRFWPRSLVRFGTAAPPEPLPRDRRCTECGEPAVTQVTELMQADIHLKLPGALPRCRQHGRILLRHL